MVLFEINFRFFLKIRDNFFKAEIVILINY